MLAPGALALDDASTLNTPHELFACAIAGLLAKLRTKQAPEQRLLEQFGLGGVVALRGLAVAQSLVIGAWLDLVQVLSEQIRARSDALPTTLARLEAVVGPARTRGTADFFSPDPAPGLLAADHAGASAQPSGRWLGLLNFAYAIGKGYYEDFVRGQQTFSALDDENYADWLRRHGAWDSTLELDSTLAPIRILDPYCGGAASVAANRSMDAGAYLHWTLRTLAYVETPFWFFVEGSGDTVITPLYKLLVQRDWNRTGSPSAPARPSRWTKAVISTNGCWRSRWARCR